MDISYSPWVWVAFAVAFWLGVSTAVAWASAWASGWSALARDYRLAEPFEGRRWRFQSARMRWGMNYRKLLTVGASEQGLFLSTLVFFRAGHPPLFIAWRDIAARDKKFLWIKMTELRLGRETPVPFRIREVLANRLRDAAGNSWPVESTT